MLWFGKSRTAPQCAARNRKTGGSVLRRLLPEAGRRSEKPVFSACCLADRTGQAGLVPTTAMHGQATGQLPRTRQRFGNEAAPSARRPARHRGRCLAMDRNRADPQGLLLRLRPPGPDEPNTRPAPRVHPMKPKPTTTRPKPRLALSRTKRAQPARRRPVRQSTPGVCRVCGCTDDDCSGCVERTGEPCAWVKADLCSACDPDTARRLARIALEILRTVNRGGVLAATRDLDGFAIEWRGEQYSTTPPAPAKPRRKK